MNRSPRHPCGSFAGIVPASRGTRPLPLHPLPSPPFQGSLALMRANRTPPTRHHSSVEIPNQDGITNA